jgi:phosphate transport system permease protein
MSALISDRSGRNFYIEKLARGILFISASISVAITLLIIISVLTESLRFFSEIPITDFLFGTKWSPQTAMRADQAGGSGSFGAIPVFIGTFLITIIAMIVAVPVGIFSAIYISEYALPKWRRRLKPALETLAGIPTVVYGYFAVTTIAPFIRDGGAYFGLEIASESALAAGLVMGVMIIPFIMSLSEDAINAVPSSLRNASLALGATTSETIVKVILPAAFPGIVGAILLGISRAIGETMIVVMAAGLAANLTWSPLDSVTTVTVQIVTLLTGDQEFDSSKTLAAFALGLTLFLVTLMLNFISLKILKKHQASYG